MAIGTPVLVGSGFTSSAASPLSITLTAAVPAGAMIFLEIANHNNLNPNSITDAATNSYTQINAANGTTVTETLVYALNVGALASGSTITIGWTSARNAAAAVYYVTGIASVSALDQQALNTSGSSATPSVGPTSATTQADELVIGLFGYSNSRPFTAGSGYTALASVECGGVIRGTAGEYKIVSAMGAQTADGTFGSSATFAGLVATFKAATGGGGGTAALSASGTIAITGSAGLSVSGSSSVALAASGSIAITGAAGLAVSGASSAALAASGQIKITGAAGLSVSGGGSAALGASGQIKITGASGLVVTGGSSSFGASGQIKITGSAGLAVVVAGGWHAITFKRPLLDRYLNVTIAASVGVTGYLAVSKDKTTWSYFAGPLAADGRTLTAVADEAAAKAAAIALPTNGVWALPTTTEARFFKLGHKGSGSAYNIFEFYPRRLVEADDIRAESIKAIHISAGSITGDRLYATAIDGFVITGATIQTSASGARVVLSSAAAGGFIGYNASDTYNPSSGTGTYQVRWSKADGKLYAGGGNTVLDASGITLYYNSGGYVSTNSLKWYDGDGYITTQIYAAGTGVGGTRALNIEQLPSNSNGIATVNLYAWRGLSGGATITMSSAPSIANNSSMTLTAGATNLSLAGGAASIDRELRVGSATFNAHIGAVQCAEWFRSYGASGWYNETYGGGWYMADTTYLRNYGGKRVLLDNGLDIVASALDSQMAVGSGAPRIGLMNSTSWASRTQAARWVMATAGSGSHYGLPNAGDTWIFTEGVGLGTAGNLYLGANNQQTLVCSTAGSVGIGVVASTTTRFDVYGFGTTSTTFGAVIRTSGGTNNFYVRDDGAGFLRAAAWTYSSDRRLKKNIRPLKRDRGLRAVMQLRPVHFDYRHGQADQIGFIAQEVDAVVPELVHEQEDGMLGMQTTNMIPMLVKAVQEQQQQIARLMQEVKHLKGQLARRTRTPVSRTA